MAASATEGARSPAMDFGRRLAQHRAARRLSQLELGLAADVSARHISFLETGRAQPSRDMVRRLAEALGLSGATQDGLLIAAGLAPTGIPRALDALDRAIAIQSAAGEDEALDAARTGLAGLGLAHFFTGVLIPGAVPCVSYGALTCAPTAWLRHYGERGFRANDLLVRAAAWAGRPFFWSDVLPARLPCGQREILGEAAAFGLTNGFVMPIQLPDGRVHALSSMGDKVACDDPRVRWEARLLATALLERTHGLCAGG